jgi:D-tyrosyl-tRNA(Tyr) deacylase
MRVVVQRVSEASVKVDESIVGAIKHGLLVLVAFEEVESEEEMMWMIQKMLKLRIFSDAHGQMNLSLLDVTGDVLIISQFTLFAQTKKGNRPSYMKSAKPEIALAYYDQFLGLFKKNFDGKLETGRFGADMKVSLINDGPVTITMDSKNKS